MGRTADQITLAARLFSSSVRHWEIVDYRCRIDHSPVVCNMDEGMNEIFYDEFDQDEAEDDEIGDVAKGDGFADMMAKILNQKTGDKIPVLAKRKTTLMKEAEGSHIDSDRLKRQRAAKKVEKEKQLVVPDLSSADFERQLRKLATRGGKI